MEIIIGSTGRPEQLERIKRELSGGTLLEGREFGTGATISLYATRSGMYAVEVSKATNRKLWLSECGPEIEAKYEYLKFLNTNLF